MKNIETKHLLLRKFKEEDYKDVYKNYASSDIVTKYVTWNTHKNEEETKEYIKMVSESYVDESIYHWAIEDKETKEVIGSIASVKNDGICAEVGYTLGLKYWNKGYMTEACSSVIEYFFEEEGYEVVLGRHIKENIASGIVMMKSGLKCIGEENDGDKELYVYKATKTDYKKNRVEYLLSKIHRKELRNFKYYTFGYQQEYRKNEQICYGYLPFIDSINPEIIVDILPDIYKYNRTGIIRESTKYITVHDTASAAPSAGTKAHNNWVQNMSNDPNNKTSVSWHYTIGDTDLYQHLPLDEVGYHAGDGTQEKYGFYETGLEYKGSSNVTISSDGYYEVGGEKTTVMAPRDSEGNIPTNNNIPYNGIATMVDENGKILIGKTWWSNSYKMIGNRGGNLNSVGIETCVNVGSNYINTMRNTAYIVGKLLERYDLNASSVKQHNFFSGKDCPMTIRHANLWEEFIDIVKVEKYRNDYLKEAKFIFESLTPEFLDNTGNVIKHENGKIVEYKVKVYFENSNEEYEYKFSSKLQDKTF